MVAEKGRVSFRALPWGEVSLTLSKVKPSVQGLYVGGRGWGTVEGRQVQGLSMMTQIGGCPRFPTASHPTSATCFPEG